MDQAQFVAKRMRRLGVSGSQSDLLAQAEKLIDGPYLTTLQTEFENNVARFGVACFASRGGSRAKQSGPRDILMWSHYAKEHRGVCFQFHLPSSPLFFAHARQIAYRDDVVRINWMDRVGRNDRMYEALATKSIHWEYEREYRIPIPDASATLQAFAPAALAGVILGCRANRETEEMIVTLEAERARSSMPRVRLYKAEPSSDSYRLRIRRLTVP